MFYLKIPLGVFTFLRSSSKTKPAYITDFSYDATGYANGTCHLDKANGYTFSTGYGYVLTSANYYVPYYIAGTKSAQVCGFTPS